MAAADVQALLGNRAAFEQLLQQLMSPTNEDRARAEELFTQCRAHADPCVGQLVVTLRQSQDVGARSLCAVLLRKVRMRAAAPAARILRRRALRLPALIAALAPPRSGAANHPFPHPT